jgi:cob(I)alamin adenosyltransferase
MRQHEPPLERRVARRPVGARSLVVVNTGDGKGKTTAAMGIVVRALARGWKVCVIQFIKSGQWRTGEEQIGRQLGVDWWAGGDGFSWDSEDLDRSADLARAAWAAARERIESGDYELVVLDEVTYPVNWGWIAATDVVQSIRDRPSHVSVVITGREAPEALEDVADTITDMRKVRHAFDQGIAARRGIDF